MTIAFNCDVKEETRKEGKRSTAIRRGKNKYALFEKLGGKYG